jgi:S-adenosylmethionine:tRNA ribosyltransferase-isomerase
MITNFHTPKSTLLMMVSAFCGHDLMKRAYEEAMKNIFYYGDAMLII